MSNFFEKINDTFDVIISNPPIRIGKQQIFEFYQQSFNYLNAHGELWLVIGQKQGAPSHLKFLQTIFNEVNIITKRKGFYVLKCMK
jgi:16S rRNA (guanine1207-N2)-methyltransferase